MTRIHELIKIKQSLMQSTLLSLIFIKETEIKVKWRLVQTAESLMMNIIG